MANPNSSEDTVVDQLPEARLYTVKKEWDPLKKALETKSRLLCFRYPKPSTAQISQCVMKCVGHAVPENDASLEKGIDKVLNSISNWKWEALNITRLHRPSGACEMMPFSLISRPISN